MIYDFIISILTYSLIYTIVVASLNLAFGFTGLVNLGHMAFFGIGAYASALLTLHGIPWYFALLASGIFAGIFGALIAAITVRLRGDYFQIVTLGLGFIAIAVSRNWISLTRGALGLPGIPQITNNNLYYMLLVLFIATISIYFFYWLTNSQTGKIFQAIRDDEIAASILGKNTYLYKVLSITISTFFAGIAGSLFAHFINFIDPTIFDLSFFILIISMLIAGGLGSLKGSVTGAFALTILSESVRFITVSPDVVGAFRELISIIILIIILIFKPRGIFGRVDV